MGWAKAPKFSHAVQYFYGTYMSSHKLATYRRRLGWATGPEHACSKSTLFFCSVLPFVLFSWHSGLHWLSWRQPYFSGCDQRSQACKAVILFKASRYHLRLAESARVILLATNGYMLTTIFCFSHCFYFLVQLVASVTLSFFLSRPWSQVSSLLPSD